MEFCWNFTLRVLEEFPNLEVEKHQPPDQHKMRWNFANVRGKQYAFTFNH